jgi:branched-chain amino acid transport system ATP-binding protein
MSGEGLRARRLRVDRDGRLLLDVEDVHAPRLRCTVVTGGGDSGKSLLTAALCGSLGAVRGEVAVNGRVVAGPPSHRLRSGLAAVPNQPLRIVGVTVDEALTLAATTRGRRRTRRLADAFDRFPLLAARRRMRAERLSGGEHQALRLACAYLAAADALVLDSPTTGLAASVVDAVLAMARDEAARGAAVLWLDQPGAPLPAEVTLRMAGGRLSAAAESRTESPSGSG